MPVQFWNNVVLFDGALVAMDPACCCSGTPTPTASPTPTPSPSPTAAPTPSPGACWCKYHWEVYWDCTLNSGAGGWGDPYQAGATDCVDTCSEADWAYRDGSGNYCFYTKTTCLPECTCPTPTPTPPPPTAPPTGAPTASPTAEPTASPTPTPSPVDCGDCSGCDSAYGIFISGLTGTFSGGKLPLCDCSSSDFAGAGVTKGSGCNWGENRALSPDCFYAMSPALHYSLWCGGDTWYVKVWQAMPASNIATFSAPNTTGCPPVNGWTQISGSCTGGSCTVF